MKRDHFNLILTSEKQLTPHIKQIGFLRDGQKTLPFIPGQFITFHFELDQAPYQRSYSIATIPGQTDEIEIAVSPLIGGAGTTKLFGMKIGDTIQTTGPFGRLILRDEQPKRYILVATGTGVTPYRAMLPELLKRVQTQNCKVIIFLGVQRPDELLYAEDFKMYAAKHGNLEFHAFYSRDMPKQPTPFEHYGYVQSGFSQLNLQPQHDVIYLCGNPNMIDQAFALLVEKGFETKQIRREKYISPRSNGT